MHEWYSIYVLNDWNISYSQMNTSFSTKLRCVFKVDTVHYFCLHTVKQNTNWLWKRDPIISKENLCINSFAMTKQNTSIAYIIMMKWDNFNGTYNNVFSVIKKYIVSFHCELYGCSYEKGSWRKGKDKVSYVIMYTSSF